MDSDISWGWRGREWRTSGGSGRESTRRKEGRTIRYPEIDRHASLDSPIHRFDPRAKLISMLFLIFSIVVVGDLKLALLGLSASVLLLLASRLPLGFVLQRMKWVCLFILPFLAILPFSVEGHEIIRFGILKATHEGVGFGALVATRALSAVILVFPMVGTTSFASTLKALKRLRVPGLLVQMLMFTYRYIFTFVDEFSRMRRSMASRGFKVRTDLHSLRTMGKVVGVLFLRSYERAERVYQAMLSAGYTGNPKTLAEFNIRAMDYVLAAFIMGFAVLLQVIP